MFLRVFVTGENAGSMVSWYLVRRAMGIKGDDTTVARSSGPVNNGSVVGPSLQVEKSCAHRVAAPFSGAVGQAKLG